MLKKSCQFRYLKMICIFVVLLISETFFMKHLLIQTEGLDLFANNCQELQLLHQARRGKAVLLITMGAEQIQF